MTYPGNLIRKDPLTPTQTAASGIWTLDQAQAAVKNNTWPVSNGVSRSLRFNSADSAYLSRSPASAGNRRTWTWSGWTKISKTGFNNLIECVGPSTPSTRTSFMIQDSDKIDFFTDNTSSSRLISTQVFRDFSAWYHIVLAVDTTQATASNRVKIYVNGSQITAFTTANYPAQNLDTQINNTQLHTIGRVYDPFYANMYLTDVYFIDGQALTPSDFAFTDPDSNQWRPKRYSGSYGVNGFYLDFSDNTSTTNLGLDRSGNANHWTASGFSVTTDSDSVVDTPTNYNFDFGAGGEVRGNYCIMDPLTNSKVSNTVTITNGNLTLTTPVNTRGYCCGSVFVNTGKYYYEVSVGTYGDVSDSHPIGITRIVPSNATTGTFLGTTSGFFRAFSNSNSNSLGWYDGVNSVQLLTGAGWWENNAIYGIEFDVDNNSISIYKNGVLGATRTGINLSGFSWTAFYESESSASRTPSANWTFNFGQTPFAYAAPEGFKCLCSTNLPEPTIRNGGEYFNTVLYTGNGSTQSITNVGFQPDFTWIKSRTNTYFHALVDSARGNNNLLYTNATNAESGSGFGNIIQLSSNGFNLTYNSSFSITSHNHNSDSLVAWNWRANGAGSSNTAGSVTSTVSVNTTSGFSIVTYTGNGVSGATVGHGLSAAPRIIILKSRSDGVYNWRVYHASLTAGHLLQLNTTDASVAGSSGNAGFISSVSTTTFTLTQSGANVLDAVNKNGDSYVAYCFAEIPGYSAFSSYIGNGNADGPFVYTGFRPRWILTKRASTAGAWHIYDTQRSTFNLASVYLVPSTTQTEFSGDNQMDILSNGFKLRSTNTGTNENGTTLIYAAFAERPFKYSRAR